ncbi:MAG: glycosyltransferase family 2 protein, partial [Phycisphaerae bacterium]|nr:glycosyltransferase family 2 protein [Phycisphaerae bacterium]
MEEQMATSFDVFGQNELVGRKIGSGIYSVTLNQSLPISIKHLLKYSNPIEHFALQGGCDPIHGVYRRYRPKSYSAEPLSYKFSCTSHQPSPHCDRSKILIPSPRRFGQRMKLIVNVPALNEEKTIAQVVNGVPRNIPGIDLTEVIVLNDGSTDRTAELAEEAGALVINIVGRPGLGAVFRTGLERAMRRGADIIVNIDGDMQFNPADIAILVQPLLRDEADFVTCSRFADPALRPTMPGVKFYGNAVVTYLINWVCGGTNFSDVSCGFRAFNREAAYRLTLFGRFTYTQECFIDLFSKGLRIMEVPLKVRGVREHGKSRIANSIWKYATNSLPIILRAMRDIQPLKFFGGIGAIFFTPGILAWLVVTVRYAIGSSR